MRSPEPFVDIHCHLLPGIDDGAKSLDESLAMARMAVADGIGIIVATPHQLGNFGETGGDTIRLLTTELQEVLHEHDIPLRVVPGADVRIEPDLVARLCRGDVVSLADAGRHVLLELPHEMYVPLDRLLGELRVAGYVGILSHPERNEGIFANAELVPALVAKGCLMQLTAGSLLGGFGPRIQRFSEELIRRGCVHFIASDAHGVKSRRPLLQEAFRRVVALAGRDMALDLCCRNPARVVAGTPVASGQSPRARRTPSSWLGWLPRKQVG